MTGRIRKQTVVIILVVLAIAVIAFVALTRIKAGIDTSVEHKSAKHTTATAVSVTAMPASKTPDPAYKSQLFKVCFTIDDFDQVRADMRAEYQSAEARRLTKEGPRCKVTRDGALAKKLSKGDKLSVVYLLENDYQIDLAAINAYGEAL